MKLSFYLLCITLLCGLAKGSNLRSENDIAKHLMKHARKSQSDRDKSEFSKITKLLALPHYVYRSQVAARTEARNLLMCTACRSTMKSLITMRKEGASNEMISEMATVWCELLNIESKEVCEGVVKLNVPILTYIIDHEPAFNEKTFCGIILQSDSKKSCAFNDPRFEWEIDIPLKPNNTNEKLRIEEDNKDNKKIKILHLTDIHYDPKYEPNGVANCDAPTCCRKGQKERKVKRLSRAMQEDEPSVDIVHEENGVLYLDIDGDSPNKQSSRVAKESGYNASRAGYWGDYRNCDTPWWAFTDAIDHIAETHKDIDYIYYTGDTIDHGVWETTKEMITTSVNDTVNYIKGVFGDIPVYSIIGNHESQPLNQYADSNDVDDLEFSTSWLYDLLAEKWSVWLPEQTKETIKIGGYYTALLKPGFRVVALNNNICYIYNWWIHLTPNDISGQLKWLVKVLTDAEKNNEKVHILAHIPAGITDCFYTYNREYKKIIERFANTITAEFNGHTHNDEFKVYYNKESEPFLVGWNGGSLTSYSYLNLNYKVFEIDNTTTEVINNEVWIYNLTEANLNPDERPTWYKEYDFQEAYNLTSLEPKNIHGLLERMVTTEKDLLKEDYHNYRWKSSDEAKECNSACVEKNLCYMTTTELYDDNICKELIQKYYQD